MAYVASNHIDVNQISVLIGIILGVLIGIFMRFGMFEKKYKDPNDIISEINKLTQSNVHQ